MEFKDSTKLPIILTQKGLHQDTSKLSKINAKDRNLRATREKEMVTYKKKPIRLSSDFSAQPYKPERSGIKYSNY